MLHLSANVEWRKRGQGVDWIIIPWVQIPAVSILMKLMYSHSTQWARILVDLFTLEAVIERDLAYL